MIIDRVFIMVLLLTISGFVFCAIFIPFEKYAYRLTSARTMVWVNTAALFSFVTPLYFINSIYDSSEEILINGNVLVFEDNGGYEDLAAAAQDTVIIENLRYIWLAGATIFLVFHIWGYIRFLKLSREGSFKLTGGAWAECFASIKEKSNQTRVELIGSCAVCSPCTIGVVNKKIVVPAAMINSLSDEEIGFILNHEFYHVINNDVPRKLFILILNTLNWLNPLFYALRNNLSEWQEAACDNYVTGNFSRRERNAYCQLLVSLINMEDEIKKRSNFVISFKGNGIKICRRRISKVMEEKSNNSRAGKVVVYSLAAVAMISGNVAAKELDMPINKIFSKNVEVVSSENIEEGNFESEIEVAYYYAEDIPCTTVYNNIADVPIETQHSHNFVGAQLKEHKKSSDDSCITTYYAAKECTVCGVVVKGEVTDMLYKAVCPH